MAKFYDSRGQQVPAENVTELFPGTSIYWKTAQETAPAFENGTPKDGEVAKLKTHTVKTELVIRFSDDEQFTERVFHERQRAQLAPRR